VSDLKNKILSMASEDLAEIEHALKQNLSPYLDLVAEVASHILFSGGKRLRPLLTILSARICGYKGNMDKTYSTIFEYLHAATLLHDDLVDEATIVVDFQGNAKELADALMLKNFESFGINIYEISQSHLRIRLVSS